MRRRHWKCHIFGGERGHICSKYALSRDNTWCPSRGLGATDMFSLVLSTPDLISWSVAMLYTLGWHKARKTLFVRITIGVYLFRSINNKQIIKDTRHCKRFNFQMSKRERNLCRITTKMSTLLNTVEQLFNQVVHVGLHHRQLLTNSERARNTYRPTPKFGKHKRLSPNTKHR